MGICILVALFFFCITFLKFYGWFFFSPGLKEKFFSYKQLGCASQHVNHWFLFHSDCSSVCGNSKLALQCQPSTLSNNWLGHRPRMRLTWSFTARLLVTGHWLPDRFFRRSLQAQKAAAGSTGRRLFQETALNGSSMAPVFLSTNHPPTTKDTSVFLASLPSMTMPRPSS
jgi:hypothetical protein